jgi:hypothetical protein
MKSFKSNDGRIGCLYCKLQGKDITFSAYSGLSRHYRTSHDGKAPQAPEAQTQTQLPQVKKKILFVKK